MHFELSNRVNSHNRHSYIGNWANYFELSPICCRFIVQDDGKNRNFISIFICYLYATILLMFNIIVYINDFSKKIERHMIKYANDFSNNINTVLYSQNVSRPKSFSLKVEFQFLSISNQFFDRCKIWQLNSDRLSLEINYFLCWFVVAHVIFNKSVNVFYWSHFKTFIW